MAETEEEEEEHYRKLEITLESFYVGDKEGMVDKQDELKVEARRKWEREM